VNLLLSVLRRPSSAPELAEMEWDLLLRIARSEGLLARLCVQFEDNGSFKLLPVKVQQHLAAASVIASDNERMIVWEVDRIEHALGNLNIPVILLKGAAYVKADLPPAKGRLASDVDILVPSSALDKVELALMAEGWESTKLMPYAQKYYRKWMHELPPLRHIIRQTVVDVHHTILPQTSRLKPNPELLLKASVPIRDSRFKVLAPVDMVLHSATHLFYDGDLDHGLRDLVDLHDLISLFGGEPQFWQLLELRTRELQLERPLFYTLRFCKRLLHTPIPGYSLQQTAAGSPPWFVCKIMDALVSEALTPMPPDPVKPVTKLAHWMLHVRSHYLRMPLYLLIPHLARKTLTHGRGTENEF
jgi:hypothetical protein